MGAITLGIRCCCNEIKDWKSKCRPLLFVLIGSIGLSSSLRKRPFSAKKVTAPIGFYSTIILEGHTYIYIHIIKTDISSVANLYIKMWISYQIHYYQNNFPLMSYRLIDISLFCVQCICTCRKTLSSRTRILIRFLSYGGFCLSQLNLSQSTFSLTAA